MFGGAMSITHWLIVIVVIILLFGRNKISGLMEDVGQGIRNFRKATEESKGELGDVHKEIRAVRPSGDGTPA